MTTTKNKIKQNKAKDEDSQGKSEFLRRYREHFLSIITSFFDLPYPIVCCQLFPFFQTAHHSNFPHH